MMCTQLSYYSVAVQLTSDLSIKNNSLNSASKPKVFTVSY